MEKKELVKFKSWLEGEFGFHYRRYNATLKQTEKRHHKGAYEAFEKTIKAVEKLIKDNYTA